MKRFAPVFVSRGTMSFCANEISNATAVRTGGPLTTKRYYAASKQMRITLIGAPGSGKGTQTGFIKRDFNLSTMSTGDLLRQAVSDRTPLGLEVEGIMKSGGLVSDKLVLDLLKGAITELTTTSPAGWVLDGYPRTPSQTHDLTKLLNEIKQPLTHVFHLIVDPEEVAARISERWVHPGSNRLYNDQFNPPKVPGVDDVTGEPLIKREDDKPEIVIARINKYEAEAQPIVDYFREAGLLIDIQAPNSNVGYAQIKKCLEASS
eukprot:TRINITY_DN8999_c0_g1_i1.p1 TRINITY_DN8999_c0_g1~~TRINITY_DN8999_c0_g1_i1.p1  ORF type:complete len:272 (+),score=39.59 TRINITY_DN8999_c0_g1_i1:32-817(+)